MELFIKRYFKLWSYSGILKNGDSSLEKTEEYENKKIKQANLSTKTAMKPVFLHMGAFNQFSKYSISVYEKIVELRSGNGCL